VNFGQWTLERIPWRGNERVLDIGCGPGALLCNMARRHSGWRVLAGFDFSEGMVTKAQQEADSLAVCFFVADAQAIPHPDASYDVVMARHMLYHVPSIDRAVSEAARVLRHGGFFLAVTNSASTMQEATAIRVRAAAQNPGLLQPDMASSRFSLENAEGFLRPHFETVETHTLVGTLRFPSAEPYLDYFASARSMIMTPEHTEEEWSAVLDFVRGEVEAIIRREGRFDVSKVAGAVVGIKGG
jgi:SAM-dependent methyltransferase